MTEAGPRSLTAGLAVTPNVRLSSPLGSGGMGAVWLAEHAGLKTRVVVKFMLSGGEATPEARTRFAREAEAAAKVKSPHVVQMLDHGVTEEGLPFIVMEHLEGRDLGRVLADRGKLPPVEVVAIVSQVAKALTKVHAAGLLHRDIKPDNIFVCENEDETFVKLLDFGVVKRGADGSGEGSLDGSTNTGQVVGTPFYMSPEQVTAQKDLDARSDLWALGVVAFQALTGKRPFDGPSFGALAVLIATGTPPRPREIDPTLPKEVDAWFAKACAREPEGRFASARELAEALRVAFGALVPPMSDSGQRSLSSSGSKDATSGTVPSSATPSFVNASTMRSTPAEGLAALGATGSAVVDARASRSDEGSGSRRRSHVLLGASVALASALVAALVSRSTPPARVASAAPSMTAPAKRPPPATSTVATEAIAPEPASAVDAGLAVASSATASASPSGPRLAPRDGGGASPGTAPRASSVAPPGVSAAPPSSASARPGLHPPSSHDDPLF